MLTFLHHSDPTLPHYRQKQWSFLRGAVGTVDRPLLGWAGRFFLHNVSHDHVAHHFFSMIPFYNQPQVTEAIKKVLKDDYNYDSTVSSLLVRPTFWVDSQYTRSRTRSVRCIALSLNAVSSK